MKRPIFAILSLLALVLSLQVGCAVPEEHQGAAAGAGIGAATGALAGALIAGHGSRTEGAIIGGLAGALVGGMIGDYTVDQKRSASDTSNRYGYQSNTGTVIRIESASAFPATVRPGGKVDLGATYAVMAPQNNAQVAVMETREIRLNGELVGKPEVNATRMPGTYTSNIPLFLDSAAKKGTYIVTTTIRTQEGSDSRESSFVVN